MPKILIVDDEAFVRRVMVKTLTKAGFEVVQACNGAQAWEMLCESHPDALVTDIDMPRMTGEQLCNRIEKEIPERKFPILVVTSKTALEHRTWARQIDNLSFIEKPLSLRKLIDRLTRCLGNHPVTQESAS